MIKVVFFATPKIALKSLEALVKSDKFEVLAVVTQPDKPTGRGQKVLPPPVKEFALEHGIKVFQPVSIRKEPEIIEELKKFEPDFFVTFAFGQILSKEVLDVPKFETINLHASLLPKYRGADPIQRVIIDGETQTGICTMVTEEGLDCGDICLKEVIAIVENMNCEELSEIIAVKSPELIEKTLIGIEDGKLIPKKQPSEGITIAKKIKKEDAKIVWTKSAKEIHDLVRGIYKSPSAFCEYKGKLIKVLETKLLSEETHLNAGEIIRVVKSGIEVATGNGALLVVKIKPEGKGEMFARDWANGAKIIQGDKYD